MLATLTCILFAVAGVTAATENTFIFSSQAEDQTEFSVPESTVAGRTAPQATVPEPTVPETTVPEEVGKPVEGIEEATVVVPEEPKEPGKGDPGARNYAGFQNDGRIVKAGEPEHAQGKKYGKLRVAGKPPGKCRPDHAGVKGFDGNLGKITLCHKARVPISVGSPATSAHLRHGDSLGAC